MVKQFEDLSAGHLCLILGSGASVAVFQHDMGDGLSYPDDYLSNPNPERIAEQDVVESWIEGFKNFQDCMLEFYNNREEMETEMISVEDFFVFNYMYQIEHEIYDIYKKRIHPHSATFSDIGWRALLKKAISRKDNFEEKRTNLRYFADIYDISVLDEFNTLHKDKLQQAMLGYTQDKQTFATVIGKQLLRRNEII